MAGGASLAWEKDRGFYNSYDEFKKNWDSNTRLRLASGWAQPSASIWKEIKSTIKVDLKADIEKIVGSKDSFNRRLDTNIDRLLTESKARIRPYKL